MELSLEGTVEQGSNFLDAKAHFTGGVDDLKPTNHTGFITSPATNSWRRWHQTDFLEISDGRSLDSNLARQFTNVEGDHKSLLNNFSFDFKFT
jgi:hypothetical protein